ncbi:sigma-70 family RNA polymerase sigma factor [Pseudomonas chlororaphis]|uniref:sigma-70 family RNA polymerase sigma factor n=1 Tax=Pseudomonas chlororaphis TaxID=587753 RepID=UPI000F561397|nr:sigma-70 family RNA polymerase sigma factor [Pseudomonas chlororaphis]AZC49961.1 Sigma factor, ECF subfamily [Pseudomonas chlororaphis subsp. piscium]AZC56540.1 Sigma factor, ECF subfamily [Pseudomonas chlororaphis subsp. piscium]AZC68994.1 Sigma factor, ECF subfamily [Pseudomonas chlororaphis subsp. piscium]AZC75178.1 Sigma factor, ECF subfamily [Pseudomonas chlororaphis subsp. piscium]AZC81445.1 Sigma factor, ECF subfamily [Pseudomonas chlororaphis subsp. piscium]
MHDDSFASPVARLYANHHGWLRGWLHRRLGHSADAEDLAHDTFVRVMRSQEDVRELRQPMAFLATIANGLLINRWRRQTIERAYLEALAARPVAEEPSPEERHLMIETLLQLDSLLVGLSSRVRQIFFLSQLDGLTYPQIAARLSLNVAQVQRAMGKAFSVCYASRFE